MSYLPCLNVHVRGDDTLAPCCIILSWRRCLRWRTWSIWSIVVHPAHLRLPRMDIDLFRIGVKSFLRHCSQVTIISLRLQARFDCSSTCSILDQFNSMRIIKVLWFAGCVSWVRCAGIHLQQLQYKLSVRSCLKSLQRVINCHPSHSSHWNACDRDPTIFAQHEHCEFKWKSTCQNSGFSWIWTSVV